MTTAFAPVPVDDAIAPEALDLLDLEDVDRRARRHLSRMLRERLKPPPSLTVSERADLHRRLPRTAAEPGRWRTDRTPYLREIMDAFSDPLVERVVFMKAAQIGGSEALNNVVAYFVDCDPAPVLYVLPTDGDAAKYSKERVAPMIADDPILSALVAPAKSRTSGNTIEAKEYPGGHLAITGATAPNKLRSRPRRVVLFDEVDGFPASAGSDGDPIELAVKRTSTYWNRKIGMVSTPTVRGASRIENAFNESDQRRYRVPCVACGEAAVMTWEFLVWDKDDAGRHRPETAGWECPSCKHRHAERDKPRMLAQGAWVAENPESTVVGFHLSALYSPWFPWANLVREFLSAKDHSNKLRTFINTRLGETFIETGDAPEWERLYERRESYPIGTCPAGVEFLTVGVDVQGDRFEASVWGWGYDRESWLIEHRIIGGDPFDESSFDLVTALLNEAFPTAAGGTLPVSRLAIDCGFAMTEVVAWAKKIRDPRVMMVKGDHWKNWNTFLGSPSKSDVTFRGRKTGLLLWPVGGALIKQETYGFLSLAGPLDGEPYPAGYMHLPEVDDEYCKGLVGEDLVIRTDERTGVVKREWIRNRRRNEPLDCRVYARAAAEQQGLSRMDSREKVAAEPSRPPRESDDASRRRLADDWLRGKGGGRPRGRGGWLS